MFVNNHKLEALGIFYLKKKINYLFANSKFIIFINSKNIIDLKITFLKYNIFTIIVKDNEIKALFQMPNFLFLKGSSYLCGFINDLETLLNVSKSLINLYCFFSYKNNLSNLIRFADILNLFKFYNNDYIYIQFLLKKIKIKVIILLLFFLISFTLYVK